MINTFDVKLYLNSFLNQDDTPKNLVETLAALINIRTVVNDRIMKVDKDLDFIRKMFGRHDKKQGNAKMKKLTKGAAYF
jgi:hypothetical protein